MRPRVFVSSVMDGFDEERASARQAIVSAGCEPVLIEDFPALQQSSRNACLDAVESCDAVVVVVGERGGWVAPSGKLVVQEEVEHARKKSIPVLAFISDGERDALAVEFVTFLSDYLSGNYRKTYASLQQLKELVEEAVTFHFSGTEGAEMDNDFLERALADEPEIRNVPTIRVVASPDRRGEVFDPIQFDKPEFKSELYLLGYSTQPAFFAHELPKEFSFTADGFRVIQALNGMHNQNAERIDLQVDEFGNVRCDMNVVGLRNQTDNSMSSFYILETDVVHRLRAFMRYWAALLNVRDPFGRYRVWRYNAILLNCDHQKIVKEKPAGSSFSIGIYGAERPVAFDSPRKLDVSDMATADSEIERLVMKLKRRMQAEH